MEYRSERRPCLVSSVVKGNIHSQLNWMILLRDVIPEEKTE